MNDLRSMLVDNGLTPALQRDVFLQLTRALFSSTDIIRNEYLDTYVWSSTPSVSRIQIEPVEKFKMEELGKRPAVLIAYMGSSVEVPTMMSGKIKADVANQREWRSFILGSVFEIRCVAGEAREALHIASEILIRFLENCQTIKDDYNFNRVQIDGMSKAQQVEEYDKNWVVTVSLKTSSHFESFINLGDLPERVEDFDIG